jgi:transposase InsO family protein
MQVRLHKNATTTPKIRALIQASTEANTVLAKRYGVGVETVARWKGRDSVEDRPHTAHRLQTTLSPAQEAVVLAIRETLWLSLDDLLAVVREFIHPDLTRSALHRCLKRHGVSTRPETETAKRATKPFKAYEPGYLHVDVKYLPQMGDETTRRYLYVAIDRASRWVHLAIKPHKTAAAARSFLNGLAKACPIRISHILTDNGKEFTDRLFGSRARQATGEHEFDLLCQALGIEHRLTQPRTPQTNGMVERFNGRIADILKSHHFRSGEELETALMRYAWLYNHHLPQKALGHIAPVQALKNWQDSHPHLFIKRVVNLPGHDT